MHASHWLSSTQSTLARGRLIGGSFTSRGDVLSSGVLQHIFRTGDFFRSITMDGHEDFVIDDETWAIRYLIVDTTNWWPGNKVLISTRWIERISWEESKVFINSRDHEIELHRHYDREGYWADDLAAHFTR